MAPRDGMRELVACEFRLLRYLPDVARGEFVNVGVLLREMGAATTLVRLTRTWVRVRRLDADVDVSMLQGLEAELQTRLGSPTAEQRPLLEVLDGSLSNQVQVTSWRASLAESLPAEMDRLMRLYVEAPAPRTQPREGGRAVLVSAMRRAFEGAGVWTLMRKEIRASEYTEAGDPLRIDCGYRPNGVVRMFQAVPLRGDVDAAAVLSHGMAELVKGVQVKEGAVLAMTAIVPPLREITGGEEEEAQYRFGVRLMERAQIRVMTTADLERIAETAARELRV